MTSKWKKQEYLDQKNKKKGMKVISGGMLEDKSQSSQNYDDDQRNKKNILTEEQDVEEEEEETFNLAQSVEGKKNMKYVLTIRNKYLVIEFALTLHKVLVPKRKDLISLICRSRTILPLKAL